MLSSRASCRRWQGATVTAHDLPDVHGWWVEIECSHRPSWGDRRPWRLARFRVTDVDGQLEVEHLEGGEVWWAGAGSRAEQSRGVPSWGGRCKICQFAPRIGARRLELLLLHQAHPGERLKVTLPGSC